MKHKKLVFVTSICIFILLTIYLVTIKPYYHFLPTADSPHISAIATLDSLPTSDKINNEQISTSIPPSKDIKIEKWSPIRDTKISESEFIEDLDSDILTDVAKELQSLTKEISKKQDENPEYVLRGEWVNFSHSKQYLSVLDFGIKAVKPLYYILYKSNEAGLYEYLISSAINDITGLTNSISNQNKIGIVDYYSLSNGNEELWSDSNEFRNLYNQSIKQNITNFNKILGGKDSEDYKMKQIESMGIFSIPLLLNELDSPQKRISEDSIYEGIKYIIKTYTKEDEPEDIQSWISEHESDYKDLLTILS